MWKSYKPALDTKIITGCISYCGDIFWNFDDMFKLLFETFGFVKVVWEEWWNWMVLWDIKVMKGLGDLLYYYLCILLVMMFDVLVSSHLFVCVWLWWSYMYVNIRQ